MTSCIENRAGFLCCRVLTVWHSQLLVIDSWKLSDMLVGGGAEDTHGLVTHKTRRSKKPPQRPWANTAARSPYKLCALRQWPHRALAETNHSVFLASIEELAGMDTLCSDKTVTLTQNISRSFRGVRLQKKGCCRVHCWLRSGPRTQRMSLTRCCSSPSRECRLIWTVTRLIYSHFDPAVKTTESIVAACCQIMRLSKRTWMREC